MPNYNNPNYNYLGMYTGTPSGGYKRQNTWDKLWDLYSGYLDKFYGGRDVLTPAQEQYFTESQKWMEQGRKTSEEQAMENLYARGVQASTVGTDYLAKYVQDPYARAYAGLGEQRASWMAGETARREAEAMGMAGGELEAQQRRSSGTLGTIGKLVGTVGGYAAGALIPGGSVLTGMMGAGIGGGLFGGGGGGGGLDANTMAMMQNFINERGKGANPLDFLNSQRNPTQEYQDYIDRMDYMRRYGMYGPNQYPNPDQGAYYGG